MRLSMPTVFVAAMMGFSIAPYLEFDVAGIAEPGHLKSFKTDDGERLQQLLSSAGGQIAGASRLLVNQATLAGKIAVEAVRDKAPGSPDFFYQVPGGVPAGPIKLQALIDQVNAGQLPGNLQVAEAGSPDWQSLAALMTTHAKSTTQEVQA